LIKAAKVREAIEEFQAALGTNQAPGVVAVSGGPDSVALLHALYTLRRWPLVAAHLNHQLRGTESDADEAFVREWVARLQQDGTLTFSCERLDVAREAEASGDNLEATARRLRYQWLAQVARASGAKWVATGHTADDQAETVLHHLLRGSGLKGLCGIAYRRPLAPGVELYRPLLRVNKTSILEYLQIEGLSFRHDSSNLDLSFTRNRIRQELLPLAERYSSGMTERLCQLAEQAQEVQSFVDGQARLLLEKVELPRASKVIVVQQAPLASQPRYLVREVFRSIWQRENWPMGELDYEAWDRIAAVAMGELKAVDLPGGMRVQHSGRVIQVGPNEQARPRTQ
jgi:tRNA(Ile)-lysidine synthase